VQGVLGRQVRFALESPVILLSLLKEAICALAVNQRQRQAEIPECRLWWESG